MRALGLRPSPEGELHLGPYQLLSPLVGGTAPRTWLARDRAAVDRYVVIKMAPRDERQAEAALAAEARIACLLDHRNLARGLHFGEDEGIRYLVLEHVAGQDLRGVLDRAATRGPIPLRIAAAITSQLLSGLDAVHKLRDARGPLQLLHGDLSTRNVLITPDGVVKLLNVGVARSPRDPSPDGPTGKMGGRFSYAAPEQIAGEAVDARADVFSAGVLLYLLCTGRHPFKHHGTEAVVDSIAGEQAVLPPSSVRPGLPEALDLVVMKALEREPQARFATAWAMRDALQQVIATPLGSANPRELSLYLAEKSAPEPGVDPRVSTQRRSHPDAVRESSLLPLSRETVLTSRTEQARAQERRAHFVRYSPILAVACVLLGLGVWQRARHQQSAQAILPAPHSALAPMPISASAAPIASPAPDALIHPAPEDEFAAADAPVEPSPPPEPRARAEDAPREVAPPTRGKSRPKRVRPARPRTDLMRPEWAR